MLPHKSIESRLQAAVSAVLPGADTASVLVRPCPDPKFGDYQSNALMALAKERKMNPRQLATEVVARLEVADICEPVEIAGAGFLNFRLKPAALTDALQSAARGEHLFFTKAALPRTAVVDFSSPNVAKPMHVGHVRSTGIGDAIQRILRLLGHHVITDNHIGDWGTQFGKLIAGWKILLDADALKRDPIAELERIYKFVNTAGEADPAILENARQELVKLQAGDAENIAIWQEMIRLSQVQFNNIYSRLGVTFDHTLGESFYNPWLGHVVGDLLERGIARESEGAVGVFSDGSVPPKEDPFLVNRDGEWIPDPAIIRKSDGGFNYTTTDLATLDYRMKTWSPQEIIYVVDDRQSAHFKKLFLIFKRWQPDAAKKVKLVHVGFGKILGEDGKPFKTRSGETVKLSDLLNEAEERAYSVVTEKNADLPEAQRKEIARVVGLGAIKYADLVPNRQSDYVFSWDKMLALNGNTAPYLQYAYARIKSIFRKAEAEDKVSGADESALTPAFAKAAAGKPALSPGRGGNDFSAGVDIAQSAAAAAPSSALRAPSPPVGAEDGMRGLPLISLNVPAEIALARHLLNFGLVLEAVTEEYRPNYLCNYLYELAGHFARFYENCPVLKAESAERASRLVLCDLTARVLRQGLEVLGIETLEQM